MLRLFIIAIYAPRKTTLPGVCSPVEAGEVARVSATKRGRPAEGASPKAQNDKPVFAREHSDRGNPRNKGRSGCIVVRTPIFGYALTSKREKRLARDDSVITLFLFGDAGFAKFDKVLDLHLSDISLRPVANGNFARSRFLLADYEHIRNTL